ncbi:hypothetical protein BN1222_03573 [Klebsiella quasipneumoniae]|uniref:hypothetical protein n=1 Tax=Klebsiella quasipneumoniae TaxID=1463165 RepID=UPI0005E4A277|nr:hypothetical protein [Klebsiella quasipneumoniae]CEL82311.1 hypothetical protein BN1222_03573 [Klebsiella quasipneumoniae]
MIDDNYKDISELDDEEIRDLGIKKRGESSSKKLFAVWRLTDWQKQEATRPDTVKLFREIEARNNKALDDDIKYREGLSKAASLYYKGEFNTELNKYINAKGYSPYRLTRQEKESSVYQRQGKN